MNDGVQFFFGKFADFLGRSVNIFASSGQTIWRLWKKIWHVWAIFFCHPWSKISSARCKCLSFSTCFIPKSIAQVRRFFAQAEGEGGLVAGTNYYVCAWDQGTPIMYFYKVCWMVCWICVMMITENQLNLFESQNDHCHMLSFVCPTEMSRHKVHSSVQQNVDPCERKTTSSLFLRIEHLFSAMFHPELTCRQPSQLEKMKKEFCQVLFWCVIPISPGGGANFGSNYVPSAFRWRT